jgi:methionyl-tRNA formyltransferase
MKIAIIGRTEILYNTALLLREEGHEIVFILTAKEALEYTRTAQDFQALAKNWQIPFAQTPNISDVADILRDVRADIGVSKNYVGMVPQSVIELFPLGILNAHGGDLPRYRGNACQAWAILNGEEKVGLCVHKMIGGQLDSGDIISRDYLHISHHIKVTHVWQWMEKRTPALFKEAIDNLTVDSEFILERQSNHPSDALRCYPRRPQDGRIIWSWSALDVLRLINASNKPYQGAFCEFEGEKMVIWDAELVKDDEAFCAVPGQVTRVGEDFIEVACGIGKLKLTLVDYRKQVSTPSDFIKSIRKRLS